MDTAMATMAMATVTAMDTDMGTDMVMGQDPTRLAAATIPTRPEPMELIRLKMGLFNHKKLLLDSSFLNGFCDCHCHILPGVDDGMKTPEKSLAALEYFASHGVSAITFTPHVMEGLHNTRESLLKVFEEFKEGYERGIDSEKGGKVQIGLGAEYMLDSEFPKHLDEGLLQISKGIVLMETSYFNAPINMDEMLYDVSSGDLSPAIAHPERYIYMGMKDYERLKEKDFYLQLNLLSLTGAYGEEARSKAFDLLRRGMYDFVGTDIHHLSAFVQQLETLKVDTNTMDALTCLKFNNETILKNNK